MILALAMLAFPAAARASAVAPCARPAVGSEATPPPDLYSKKGVLTVGLSFYTALDDLGRTLFCLVTPDGLQSPTLHVYPGDQLNITLTNKVPPPPPGSPTEVVSNAANLCGDATMTIASVNLHFHGANVMPTCHSDQVIHTVVNSGESFQYTIQFPKDEPPGLYWYHPHIHGISEAELQGGASGAIIVEGLAHLEPEVARLPQRVLLIRDQNVGASAASGDDATPAWDLSLNYVPVPYPSYTPAVVKMKPGARELWRVVNASADTIVDLRVTYDNVAQPLRIVALDGIALGSMDGSRRGTTETQTDILVPPAGRVEFILDAPSAHVKTAILQTLNVDTGPDGDNDPARPLATIQTTRDAPSLPFEAGLGGGADDRARFENLAKAAPNVYRSLYFSEVLSDPSNPASPTNFFITVDGVPPTLFDPNNPPAITTTQGTVEDWTIQNRSEENHEFHIHQIHFLLIAVNGEKVPKSQQQFYDTYQIPYWDGVSPYPSITVRMDFRGPIVGDFVYHCHILGHEDAGMMAILRVLPR